MPATRAVWAGLLDGLLAGRPVRRVIWSRTSIPTMSGLAGWLCASTGAELLMSRTEWLTCRALALDDTDGYVDGERAQLSPRRPRRGGHPAPAASAGTPTASGVSEPPAGLHAGEAGDQLQLAGSTWRVLVGEGHAPEQVTLYCAERKLLLAADQILPRISPVIGVWAAEPDADPLGDFLRSLAPVPRAAGGLPRLAGARRCRSWACTSVSISSRTITTSGWSGRSPPARSPRPLPPCCARCSRARSTPTRPGSPWPRRWRTSTGWCATGRLERWAEPDGALLYRAR